MAQEPRDSAKHRKDDPASRAKAIIASLREGAPTSGEVSEAFWELDRLPLDIVRDALAAWLGPLPDADRLDNATRLHHGLPLRPLRLRTLSLECDADVLDLGPVAEEQLRIAGASWDGEDRAAEDRLDGELEGSFAGTLERRVLADVEAYGDTPLFDVLRFAGDSGVVFASGSTRIVAWIAYNRVEMRDRRIRIAIEAALVAPAELSEAEPAIEEAVAKEPVAKKVVAKKVVAKKVVAKKVVAKKVVAKKVVAKKVVAKKAVAKKAVAKKAVAKKAVAKKAAKKR